MKVFAAWRLVNILTQKAIRRGQKDLPHIQKVATLLHLVITVMLSAFPLQLLVEEVMQKVQIPLRPAITLTLKVKIQVPIKEALTLKVSEP